MRKNIKELWNLSRLILDSQLEKSGRPLLPGKEKVMKNVQPSLASFLVKGRMRRAFPTITFFWAFLYYLRVAARPISSKGTALSSDDELMS